MKVYLFRTGERKDNHNFQGSVLRNLAEHRKPLWGVKSTTKGGSILKKFSDLVNDIKHDIVYVMFLSPKEYSNKVVGVALIEKIEKRELGDLINISMTNEELGWDNGDWDYEITFSEYIDVSELDDDLLGIRVLNEKNLPNKQISQGSIPNYSEHLENYMLMTLRTLLKFKAMRIHSF